MSKKSKKGKSQNKSVKAAKNVSSTVDSKVVNEEVEVDQVEAATEPSLDNAQTQNTQTQSPKADNKKGNGKVVEVKAKDVKKDKVKKPNKLAKNLKDTGAELKKVTWPKFGEVVKQTGIVLVVVLVFALILLGLDRLCFWLTSYLY